MAFCDDSGHAWIGSPGGITDVTRGYRSRQEA